LCCIIILIIIIITTTIITTATTTTKEFARNIPKPKPIHKEKKETFDHDYMTADDEFGMSHENAMRLQELEAKHNDSQAQLDAIKRALKR